jgi:hypothetical protein
MAKIKDEDAKKAEKYLEINLNKKLGDKFSKERDRGCSCSGDCDCNTDYVSIVAGVGGYYAGDAIS